MLFSCAASSSCELPVGRGREMDRYLFRQGAAWAWRKPWAAMVSDDALRANVFGDGALRTYVAPTNSERVWCVPNFPNI